ncbi:MAG: hypothetical protein NVS9B7_23550 [Flavisolibacter sp.]
MNSTATNPGMIEELKSLKQQLEEANETIEAIRTGQVDALVVKGKNGHELYTLKSADQSYRVFIEKMNEGAVTLDLQKLILYSNSRFALMVNKPLSEVIGSSILNFIHPQEQKEFEQLFSRGFKEDCKAEFTVLGNDREVSCLISITALALEEGVSLSMIVTDLTGQKQSARELMVKNELLNETNLALELSNTDLQQFAYVASHDLQEPLRKIIMYASHLKEKHQKEFPSASSIFLEKIIASSSRMKTLILDILNYSRLASDEINFQPSDLNDIIAKLLEDFELLIKDKKAFFDIGALPQVEVVPAQIRQVFQNLISNALKFSIPETPCLITIRGSRIAEKSFTSSFSTNGPFSLITVQDNGIGFDEKHAVQIFTLFERLHSKDKYEGTGIGLSITKKIIEKHHGMIMAESKEGQGTKFSIILPIRQT